MEILKYLFGGYTDEEFKTRSFQTQFVNEKFFDSFTSSGFTVVCKAFYLIDKIDANEFTKHKMHEEGARDMLVLGYQHEILIPYLRSNGSFTFFLNKLNIDGRILHQPLINYLRRNSDGTRGLDSNLVKSFEDLQTIEYKRKGCNLRLFGLSVYREDMESLIMENFNKLDWNQFNAILANPRYMEYEDWLVVVAQKRRLELTQMLFTEQFFQDHSTSAYRISTKGVDNNVRLTWSFKVNEKKYRGWNLLGFRSTSGFSNNKWSETDNGPRVIDSYSDGSLIDSLVPGETYYYTFFVNRDTEKAECLRFSLRVPPNNERQSLDNMIEAFRNRGGNKSVHEIKIAEILEQIIGERNQRAALKSYQLTETEKIRNRRLPTEEEQEELAELDDHIRTTLLLHNL